ncbi:MAG: ribose-phosphate pyrophosphokinase [Caedimonadaceae bacterium]|nr:MAG: ribose-phosphate pyrophosphokinase [Caedimonadaceae bacterium]
MKIISGNSNPLLAEKVSKILDIPLTQAAVKSFADHEISVEIHESIRGEDVYLIQSTSSPANDHLMELLIMIDASKRGSAKRITAVLPYFGYARQDRKTGPRTPISAKLVADLLTTAGAHRVLTCDLHTGQIQGFFDIPLDNMFTAPLFSHDIKQNFTPGSFVIVSPDVGGVVRARAVAKRVNADLAIIDKRREKAGVSEVMNIIGDIKGRTCILIDDIIDSAGTLCNAAEALINAGAISVSAYASHGVFSGSAFKTIQNSVLEKVSVTDSIHAKTEKLETSKIHHITISTLLAEAINRISLEKSVSCLFD